MTSQPFRAPNFVDLTAGAGSLSLGLESAGFTPLRLFESDPDALRTLSYNRQWPLDETPVHKATMQLRNEKVALVAGSLSSAGVSVAGRVSSDSGDAIYENALRLIGEIGPLAVMLINVQGLLQKRFIRLRAEVDDELTALGYQLSWTLIDAADFGLPQSRKRAVLVAIQHSAFRSFEWPVPTSARTSVGDALYPLMAAEGWPGARQWANLAQGLAPTIVGGSKRHGGADLGPTRAKSIWYALGIDPRGIAERPPNAETPSRFMPRLTNGMVAALQGFPPEWQFAGKKTSVYRQIASAFPAPVAFAIGQQLRRSLEF